MKRVYQGPYPDIELSLYEKSLNAVFALLEQIYLQQPPLTLYGKDLRWDGINDFYTGMGLISRRKPGQVNIPFICRQVGNT